MVKLESGKIHTLLDKSDHLQAQLVKEMLKILLAEHPQIQGQAMNHIATLE